MRATEYGEAMAIAARALNYAVQSLSWNIGIDQEENMKPIVVFNPHAWESRVNVELEVGGIKDQHVLLDEAGSPCLPAGSVEAASNGRYRLSFMAELPSLGYRVYKFMRIRRRLRWLRRSRQATTCWRTAGSGSNSTRPPAISEA